MTPEVLLSVSGWLAQAAAARLRADALSEFLDTWEVEREPLTANELATAAAQLGSPPATSPQPEA